MIFIKIFIMYSLIFYLTGCASKIPPISQEIPKNEQKIISKIHDNIDQECQLSEQEIQVKFMKLNDLPKDVILVDSRSQRAYFNDKVYIISTAKNGLGEQKNSFQTPRGWHVIRAKIGENEPIFTIFKSRRPVGLFTPELRKEFPHKDWILSRILWLSGCEIGKNRLGDVDSMQRFIYFHGSVDTNVFGSPTSKGCIRMHNHDIVELFDLVTVGQKVFIQ